MLGVADAIWVGGSLATGDYVPGVSDLDLVAVASQPLSGDALAEVARLHEDLDAGPAHGMDLGCQYPDAGRLLDVTVEHPTWTHGDLLDRAVSLVTRVELVLHGYSLLGPPPARCCRVSLRRRCGTLLAPSSPGTGRTPHADPACSGACRSWSTWV